MSNVKYLFGKRLIPLYAVLAALSVGVGCVLRVELVWNLADLFNGLMAIPNILALLLLGGTVAQLTRQRD